MGSRWWSRLTNRKTQCHVSWKTIRGEYVWEYRSEHGYIGGRNWKGKMDGRARAVARLATALGGQAVTEFIVLRCSYTEGRFVPPTMPPSSSHSPRLLASSPPCFCCLLGRHAASLSLSHTHTRTPPRTYPVLFVSVTGKWPLRTTILHSLSLSLSLFSSPSVSPSPPL